MIIRLYYALPLSKENNFKGLYDFSLPIYMQDINIVCLCQNLCGAHAGLCIFVIYSSRKKNGETLIYTVYRITGEVEFWEGSRSKTKLLRDLT